MQLADFLEKYAVMNEAERLFVRLVFYPVLGEHGLDFLNPQCSFIDSHNKNRLIDFAIETGFRKYAIEIDGFVYHAEGQVSREKFADDIQRENELKIAGWFVLRFAYDTIVQKPENCMDQLHRAIAPDDDLNPLFQKREIVPHIPQQLALEAFEKSFAAGHRKGLVVLATGLGKTLLAAFIAKRLGGRVLFLAHREEILDQAAKDFKRVFPDHSSAFHKAEHFGRHEDFIFATVQTLSQESRLKSFNPDHFSFVIVDESHHTAAETYRQVLEHLQPKFLLGLTATPDRMDNREILPLYGNNLIFEMSLEEGIRRGFLTPFTYYGLYDDIDYSQIYFNGRWYNEKDLDRVLLIDKRDEAIIKEFKQRIGDRKAIGFCVSKKHALRSADKFNAAGIKSVCIVSGETRMELRRHYVQEFRNGKIQVVFVRDIFNEGVDVPDVEALLFLRPTESKTVFTQQLGRGLRVSPRKERVVVLDFVGNDKMALEREKWIRSLLGEKEAPEKREYQYDNSGNEVHFSAEVIQLFFQLEAGLKRPDSYYISFVEEAMRKGHLAGTTPPIKWLRYSVQLRSADAECVEIETVVILAGKILCYITNNLNLDEERAKMSDKLRQHFSGATLEKHQFGFDGSLARMVYRLLNFFNPGAHYHEIDRDHEWPLDGATTSEKLKLAKKILGGLLERLSVLKSVSD
jgi:superfamily II DNA or RNA helicase